VAANLGLAVCVLFSLGCRQDMHDQAKYEPLEASTLFEDGSSSRQFPAHTVSRNGRGVSSVENTGVTSNGQFAQNLPVALDEALLTRGEERYNIYCSPCHDRVGTGRGMIVQRGFVQPPSYHDDRLREMPVGYFYDVISNGYGQMSGYKAQIKPDDRWAIAAWIRVLQRSQSVQITSLSSEQQGFVAEGKNLMPAHQGGGHGDDGHGENAGEEGGH
jgi:mono/diheme cytochrome c family protein